MNTQATHIPATSLPPGLRSVVHGRRLVRLALAAGLLTGSFALAVPTGAGAANAKVDHVRAQIEGGTLEVRGVGRPNEIVLRLAAGDPSRLQVDVGDDGSADFSFARGDLRAIDVSTGSAADSVRIDDSNGAFTDTIPTTIDGGGGDDSLRGGQGVETFAGGNGDDTVVGGRGDDRASLGRGDDTFVWAPGDANDSIEGGDGADTMLFIGANVSENVTLSANGERLRFFRDIASVTMDTDGVETVDFKALGGTDKVTVDDLSGTDVTQTNVDLAGTLGGSAGDGAADHVVVNGTDGDDAIDVAGSPAGADVTGLATAASVQHPDATDTVSVNTGAGNDSVSANGVFGLQVFVDGLPI